MPSLLQFLITFNKTSSMVCFSAFSAYGYFNWIAKGKAIWCRYCYKLCCPRAPKSSNSWYMYFSISKMMCKTMCNNSFMWIHHSENCTCVRFVTTALRCQSNICIECNFYVSKWIFERKWVYYMFRLQGYCTYCVFATKWVLHSNSPPFDVANTTKGIFKCFWS